MQQAGILLPSRIDAASRIGGIKQPSGRSRHSPWKDGLGVGSIFYPKYAALRQNTRMPLRMRVCADKHRTTSYVPSAALREGSKIIVDSPSLMAEGRKGVQMDTLKQNMTHRHSEEVKREHFTPIITEAYIRDHLYMGVRKPAADQTIKKSFLNLERYLWISVETVHRKEPSVHFRISDWFPEVCGLEEEILWEIAEENMREGFEIQPLASLTGLLPEGADRILVVQNNRCITGAAVLAFPGFFEQYCLESGEESCYILPSSALEVIVLPCSSSDYMDPNELAELVDSINRTKVEASIQLPACVYFYRRGSFSLSILAGCEENHSSTEGLLS